jgi:FlaA1/EpsC-like NDP-sugar epimerase
MLQSISAGHPSAGWQRRSAQILVDAATWAAGLGTAVWVRYDGAHRLAYDRGLLVAILWAAVLQALVGFSLGLYRGRYQYGSFEEVAGVSLAVSLVALLLLLGDLATGVVRPVPASTPVTGGVVALVFMLASRYLLRVRRERTRLLDPCATKVVVFGAGEAGSQVVQAMLSRRGGTYRPVALLDDDPAKRALRIKGVPVRGDRTALPDVARRTGAEAVVIAVPNAGADLIRDVSARATEGGVAVKVLPPLNEVFDREIREDDVRDVQLEDLLGRRPIDIDLKSVAGYVSGKRVLVTGAGGSIGSELCRQLHRYEPAELVMLDRDESALHAVQLALRGRALFDGTDVVLADIRDVTRIMQVFRERAPQIVFHAAALKHLALLEQYPAESVKTNVWGTLSVLEAAELCDVERFVNISTDKAADPISVLGHSKRLAERLTAHIADGAAGTYLSVRFGNVLGSRGSVLHAFSAQVAAGGPVTVTHPDVTRYFMTVEEAVQLVIQAAAIGGDGEALVLDMGRPVRILDVARQLVDWSGRDLDVVFTGLRPGEKLHEDLFGPGELDHRPLHPLISHVYVPPLDAQRARWLDPGVPSDRLRVMLAECALAASPLGVATSTPATVAG